MARSSKVLSPPPRDAKHGHASCPCCDDVLPVRSRLRHRDETHGQRVPEQPGELAYRRIYRLGEVDRYEIQRTAFVDGTRRDVATAISSHEVIGPAPLKERIRFEKLVVTANGKELDQSSSIAAVPLYAVSIAPDSPEGAMELPSLQGLDSAAVGMVTDLHTFLVAVSPHAGVNHLRRVGDVYVNPEPTIGSWSNESTMPVGQDCIQITMKLVELAADTATIETSFEPPAKSCLTMRAPWMEKPVAEGTGPNNFQQVRKGEDGFSPMWGRERFVVRSVVRRSDGKIMKATMDNELTLWTRVQCDETLSNCAGEAPVNLRRSLELRSL
jgi:hypothetical protein